MGYGVHGPQAWRRRSGGVNGVAAAGVCQRTQPNWCDVRSNVRDAEWRRWCLYVCVCVC